MPRRSDNFALLFTNRGKRKETDPEFTGHGELLCPHCGKQGAYRLSAWIKSSAKAGKFFSISFLPKEEQAERPERPPQREDKFPWESDDE